MVTKEFEFHAGRVFLSTFLAKWSLPKNKVKNISRGRCVANAGVGRGEVK